MKAREGGREGAYARRVVVHRFFDISRDWGESRAAPKSVRKYRRRGGRHVEARRSVRKA
jgi:hypothetical protein